MSTAFIAINDRGYAIGEDHHAAKLTNHEVCLMRELRAADPAYWTYAKLGEKFDVHPDHARRLCKYEKRAQAAYEWRRERSATRVAR